MARKISNFKKVIEYIKTNGSINTYEAFSNLSVTRLPAVIYEIKKAGYVVKDEYIFIQNKCGNLSRCKKYYIIGRSLSWWKKLLMYFC